MRSSRYSTSRQKACQQCTSAKARCERKYGHIRCTRCAQRGLPCAYPHANASERQRLNTRTNTDLGGEARPDSPFSLSDSSLIGPESGLLAMNASNNDPRAQLLNTPSTTVRVFSSEDERPITATTTTVSDDEQNTMDFSGLDLVCPINADDIENRWIQMYIPIPGQTIKNYPIGVTGFAYDILKSYATVSINGRGALPFIHPKQIVAQPTGSPLTTCLSLVRICSNPLPGSTDAAATVLQREMHSLYELRDGYFRGIMTNLQELACASARNGLVCAADQQRARPRWEEWIVAEAKRRTLYVMYLFDSILSTREGLPTFLGSELRGLPAPANRLLWQATTRYEWEREYNIHMAEWMEGSLTIDELWPTPAELGELGIERSRWLENLDEYGTMIYAITSCTHNQ
ncbi:hypothetical protein C8Q69DRAFT_516096 [Paecilomyces variotii]|uniref:Zn(2)-C6 fungal-type domain-containing protein n=1 Tax=Byssochlamys spectabilis TaxID=264951 RepID=A0A443HZM0_BYSSP|nr:hypothetical protein C8Q69DRAFT_516096 [Paecilomyces variotii]RWQ97292.1 hypothetical protein C8Q69DRAFT_516096 [Paecilomyces variotii]